MRTQAQSWALAALLATAVAPAAFGQTTGPLVPLDLERLRFTPAGTDSMLVDTGNVLPEGGYRLLLMAHHERGILLLKGSDGLERSIIHYRTSGWLAGAWSPIQNLELSAKLPVIIHQAGSGAGSLVGVSEPKSFGLGTPELGARYALLRREDGDPVFLGLGLDIGIPGGTADAFGRQQGWAGFQFAPRVAVSREVGPVVLGANAGVRIRSREVEPGRDVGTELEQGVVVATRGEGLRAEVALQAAESLVESDFALELLGGLRLPLGGSGFEAFAIGGHGFTDIPGTPSFRIAGGIAYAHKPPREDKCQSGRSHTPAECPDQDDDGDSVRNGQDKCPLEAGSVENGGCPDTDSDGDGVVDREDKCSSEKGLPRYQGCPAPDADKDGVPDDEDKCPQEAGTPENGGCPATVTDTDKDGVPDGEDACPNEAGTAENRGCPVKDTDKDKDKDGVPDGEDACPNQAGTAENRGCPAEEPPPAKPTKSPLEHHVRFPSGLAEFQEDEQRQLDAIADYLKANPQLTIRVEGHTDNSGPDELNRTLSQQRAERVRAYLIQKGIAGSRMEAKGFGPDRPLATNDTPEGKSENRRVQFVPVSGAVK
ncbi:OmpA family protein [Corallococcus sp. BB11-1]|uniref:OmpA family protein n=1 Tax=Corallococcus sp. BB11-1 TaxID=2996783 RepID=UPI00226F9695|nr:OmpA family protein [Corallococcus sp. BB11-1]MCY1030785.1 OmpA family protein [Corallococcus sp. BB11-1]